MTSLLFCNYYTPKALIYDKSSLNPKPSNFFLLHSKPTSIIFASSNSNSSTAPEPADPSNPKSIRPRKVRRGRRSEAAAVEDLVRNSLERTFAAIKEQSADVLEGKSEALKAREEEKEEEGEEEEEIKGVVEEEDPEWPKDTDVGWGVRASDYFEKHPIKNVVADDGTEIDWEGEMEDGWVKEINCLEWERFAFHPSPLIVLVFERYNRLGFFLLVQILM